MFMLAALVLGCGEKEVVEPDDSQVEGDADTDADTDSDTDADLPDSTAEGYINLNDGSLEGGVDIVRAFSFYSDKAIFVYASSSPEASCATLAKIYDPENKEAVDPGGLYLKEHCNLTFSLVGGPPVSGYDLQTDSGGVVNAECTYGDGSWDYESGGDAGYYWTGDYYNAGAWKGSFSIDHHDQAAKSLVLDVDIREFEGTFPYADDRPGQHKARAKITGLIYTTECEGFEKLGLF